MSVYNMLQIFFMQTGLSKVTTTMCKLNK